MIDPNNVPPVADNELLARFITQSSQFRPGDQSVKPDLFIPFRLTELSVTRHREASSTGTTRQGERQMKVYPHTITQRKQVCLKTHSLAPRACMPLLADRPNAKSLERLPVDLQKRIVRTADLPAGKSRSNWPGIRRSR